MLKLLVAAAVDITFDKFQDGFWNTSPCKVPALVVIIKTQCHILEETQYPYHRHADKYRRLESCHASPLTLEKITNLIAGSL